MLIKVIEIRWINVHLKSKYCLKIKTLPLTENGTRSLLIPENRNPVLDQGMGRYIHLQEKTNKHCNQSIINYKTPHMAKIQTLISLPSIFSFGTNGGKTTKRIKKKPNKQINQAIKQ